MKVLLIGADGQLGTDIAAIFTPPAYAKAPAGKPDFELVPLTITDIDITDFNRTGAIIDKNAPDIIINTAAYHNVPECEKNPEQAFRVNTLAVSNLVKICRDRESRLIHFSTDYVFDGAKKTPYDEDDLPNPLNTYALSKLAGEQFVRMLPNYYIIRTASLFGLAGCLGKGGTNFVESMLNLAQTKSVIPVTANIISSPTYTYDDKRDDTGQYAVRDISYYQSRVLQLVRVRSRDIQIGRAQGQG
ncbi:MAG: NAD(P)-dependent oxidoreductase [Planctomycetes bacterium]|nr:NAD(P)-dependent oxidoreductase [Planctomycetota bacterium]